MVCHRAALAITNNIWKDKANSREPERWRGIYRLVRGEGHEERHMPSWKRTFLENIKLPHYWFLEMTRTTACGESWKSTLLQHKMVSTLQRHCFNLEWDKKICFLSKHRVLWYCKSRACSFLLDRLEAEGTCHASVSRNVKQTPTVVTLV